MWSQVIPSDITYSKDVIDFELFWIKRAKGGMEK